MRPAAPSRTRAVFRLLVAGFVAGIALLAGTAAGAGDPATLRDEASSLAAQNAGLSALEKAALLDLFALESRLTEAERRAASLRVRLAALHRQETATRRALELAREAQAAAQRDLGERLRALYVQGDPDPIEVILGAASLEDAIDAIDGLSRLAQEDDRILTQVRSTRADLRTALAELARGQAKVRRLAAQAEAARASLERARDERATYVASLRRRRALNTREIRSLTARAAEAEQKAAEIQALAPAPTGEEEIPAEPTGPAPNAADGSPLPGRQIEVSMTMYCLTGTTATGVPVQHGIVATDPSYIPLGTRMFVPGYGDGVAADTGSAVKGWTIDAWVASCAQADAWGRRPITITLYD